MNIGDKIKDLRKELGISQQTLAEKINIPQSSISLYEKQFVENCSREKKELPVNKTVNNDPDFPLRFLDCAVIEFLHSITKLNRGRKDNSLSPFDSVRSVFWEGSPLYDRGFGYFIYFHSTTFCFLKCVLYSCAVFQGIL